MSDYEILSDDGAQRSGPCGFRKRFSAPICLCFTLFSIAATATVTWQVTKNALVDGGKGGAGGNTGLGFDPTKAYGVPSTYTASLKFKIPYINFEENVLVHVSEEQSMRLEYYGGLDTFIFNTNATSYEIVPVIDKKTCLKTGATGTVSLQHPFPDLTLFTRKSEVVKIFTENVPSGLDTYEWKFEYGSAKDCNGGLCKYTPPNPEGYVGTYSFYVDARNGSPVRLHMKMGHNVVLGGSHYDEYIVEYVDVSAQTYQDPSLFAPPSTMECIDFGQISGGPTGEHKMRASRHGARTFRNPLQDIVSHFPEGATQRGQDFAAFRKKHRSGNAAYASEDERRHREAIFHTNLRYISAANRMGRSFRLGVNHMADWTIEERQALLGNKKTTVATTASGSESGETGSSRSLRALPLRSMKTDEDSASDKKHVNLCGTHTVSKQTPPANVDWRDHGAVLPAKDQGTCGSCWTYGLTGTIEGQLAIKHGKGALAPLSQQNVMDCSWDWQNNACDGGLDYMGASWMLTNNNGSIATAESYGNYLNQDGFCHYDLSRGDELSGSDRGVQEGARIKSCTHITEAWNNVTTSLSDLTTAFRDALATVGPLSVSVDAGPNALPTSQHDFYFYSSGLYYNPACASGFDQLDHTVLAVGYEEVGTETYTIIRNSWSDHWGDDGYIYVSQKDNNCGVMTQAMYATLA